MSGIAFFAIGVGAALGAWLRWILGFALNTLFAPIPLGTLAANLIGGYIIGVAMGLFTAIPALAPEWRLFIITGFCGGLTTFSTFSAEVTILLRQGQFSMMAGAIAAHVAGSLAMTSLGLATIHWLNR